MFKYEKDDVVRTFYAFLTKKSTKRELLPAGTAVKNANATRLPADPKRVYSTFNTVLIDQEIAPGVFAVFPDDAYERTAVGKQVSTASGFIIGEKGVLVVDAQQTKRLATNLIELIREKTSLPILYMVNTVYYGDHSFGNQFFAHPKFKIINDGTKIIQHAFTQKMIQENFEEDRVFEYTLSARKEDVAEMVPVEADILIHGEQFTKITIDLGNELVDIIYPGRTQTDGNLFVYAQKAKVLFGGNSIPSGGATVGMPWLTYGGLDQFTSSLKELHAYVDKNTLIVSGHGHPTDMTALSNIITYFEILQKELKTAVQQKLTLTQTLTQIKKNMSQYSNHTLYEMIQNMNIEAGFKEYTSKK